MSIPPWLETIAKGGASVAGLNLLRSIGPFLISQNENVSEAFLRYQGRQAEVVALKDLLKAEVETRVTIRRTLLDRYIDAPTHEKLQIQQNIEYVDGLTRQLGIAAKSLLYLDDTAKQTAPDKTEPLIGDHWIDRFNTLARMHNEEWRGELLARALAQETGSPGSVSPRTLWLIGNMDEDLFKAFSDLLDVCLWIGNKLPFVPDLNNATALSYSLNRFLGDKLTIGHLKHRLNDIGVLANLGATITLNPGETFLVIYNQRSYRIVAREAFNVTGVYLSPLGTSISQFYDPSFNKTGDGILDTWIESLKEEGVDVELTGTPVEHSAKQVVSISELGIGGWAFE